MQTVRSILCPVDFSEQSRQALRESIDPDNVDDIADEGLGHRG